MTLNDYQDIKLKIKELRKLIIDKVEDPKHKKQAMTYLDLTRIEIIFSQIPF